MACKKAFFTRGHAKTRDKRFYLLKYSSFFIVFTGKYRSNNLQQKELN